VYNCPACKPNILHRKTQAKVPIPGIARDGPALKLISASESSHENSAL
jgi:hypothetical protein